MKLGLQIRSFDWPGGTARIAARLAEIAKTAEAVGYDSIWVFDHFFQIPHVGPAEEPMLEAYSLLSYLAGQTKRVKLGALATGVIHRYPGVLVKTVTTLDVLSGGRACLGIGAAWNKRECDGLGIPFPPLKTRFEMLEETLKIAKHMWGDGRELFRGKHFTLLEPLNSPQPISKPHPPILVAGGGERKTLRLAAKYADACNFFSDDLDLVRHKLEVLRGHCEEIGRDYNSIEKTAHVRLNVGEDGNLAGRIADRLGVLAEMGIQTAIGGVARMETLTPLEIIGRDVIPKVAKL
jgi:F420-dependent oxidoreductase-like protein